MKKSTLMISLLVLCFTLFSISFASADTNVNVSVNSNTTGGTEVRGNIDWSKGFIQATGIGITPISANSAAQATAMARRAAVVDAYRNLVEQIGEVRVEANTTVKNYEVDSDVVQTRISGLVQGAHVVSEQIMPDGSYQVTMQVNMFGVNSVAAALEDKMAPPQILSEPTVSAKYQPPSTNIVPAFSGVIVDCRGLGLQRVMSPRIYDETGRIVYGNMYIDPDRVVQKGMVDYLAGNDVGTIGSTANRAGVSPIIVKAISLKDFDSNPVISQADADKILAANAQCNFFAKTAVAFEE
jgi:hypothetical protein